MRLHRRPGMLALGLIWLAGAAQAGLEVCNRTDLLQAVSIGYKGETDWTSEGWWNIEPGACATLVAGDLKKRYYYYYAESEGRTFQGQNYDFCTDAQAYTIVGDTDCEAQGYETLGFREIDTGETATQYTLSIEDSVALPSSGGSKIGTAPGGGTGGQGRAAPPADTASLSDLTSDISPGRHGTPFTTQALFQGCELEEGEEYCSFHAGGRKLRAAHDGATPISLMLALETLDVNTPVQVQGDRIGAENLVTEVVLRKVTPRPGGDGDAALRAALQGDWVSEQDHRIGFTIRGSELYTRYDGEFRGVRFVALAASCDAARGRGPVLVQTKLKDRTTGCYIIERAEGGVLELTDPTRGARLRYVADR